MPRYDIDPEGVEAVVTSTGHAAEQIGTILGPLADGPVAPGSGGHPTQGATGSSGYVSTAAAGCGGGGPVVEALGSFFEAEGRAIEAISTRINACLTGAVAATTAYLHGDEEMVATYQRNASQLTLSHYHVK